MWSYIILGILQGIFEWIPISSEGVVVLASRFLVKEINPVDIALFLHLGTLFAVLIYFWQDWKEVLTFKNPKLLRFLIITAFLSLLIGFPFYKLIKNFIIGNSILVIMGFGLLLTSYFHQKKRTFNFSLDKLALISGFLQGLAVIPGLSRSGSTIFGLSLGKMNPSEILKLSYMMSVPAILASSFYIFSQNQTVLFESWPSLVFSFLVGILSLHFLINLSQKVKFSKFTLLFAILCFVGAIIGFII